MLCMQWGYCDFLSAGFIYSKPSFFFSYVLPSILLEQLPLRSSSTLRRPLPLLYPQAPSLYARLMGSFEYPKKALARPTVFSVEFLHSFCRRFKDLFTMFPVLKELNFLWICRSTTEVL